jgi:hypothetical protein
MRPDTPNASHSHATGQTLRDFAMKTNFSRLPREEGRGRESRYDGKRDGLCGIIGKTIEARRESFAKCVAFNSAAPFGADGERKLVTR